MARTFIGTASAPLPFSALVKSAFVPSSEGVRAALTGLARTTFGRLTEEEREELSAKFLACCMLVVGHTQRRPQERMAKVGGRKHQSLFARSVSKATGADYATTGASCFDTSRLSSSLGHWHRPLRFSVRVEVDHRSICKSESVRRSEGGTVATSLSSL